MFVSFEAKVKGGLPCTVEAIVSTYREGYEIFASVDSIDVFWPGSNRRMSDKIWKSDIIDLEEQAMGVAL